MAQHGYLREYDEGWDRGSDRDRERRDYDRDRQSDRGMMYRDRDREHSSRHRGDDDRGNLFFGRDDDDRSGRGWDDGHSRSLGDRARSWFRDDDDQYRGAHEDNWDRGSRGGMRSGQPRGAYGGFQGYGGGTDQSREGSGRPAAGERSRGNFRSLQDDHYRNWREQQMSALDRDYEDYCREREQQFHQDFDSWRRNRQSGSQSGQQGGSSGSEEALELNNPTDLSTEPQSGPSATADATLGTNNSENSIGGRNL